MSDLPTHYVDQAMYPAEPMPDGIQVFLVNSTRDPLGTIAAASMIYEGKVQPHTYRVTDQERLHYWAEMSKTKLTAPLEFVDLHFLISGVSRAFTHQMVRQRTAVYAQESLRFAVKDNFAEETPLPPSLLFRPDDDPLVVMWRQHMQETQMTYSTLVAAGLPAEDARGLLPHQTTTRLHYKTNLRNLVDHVGNRLCTQAQFEWKMVIFKMMQAIKTSAEVNDADFGDGWQWEQIMHPMYRWFAPACYAAGKCPFKADFDRGCTIRERADRGAFDEIEIEEWAADPTAAWTTK